MEGKYQKDQTWKYRKAGHLRLAEIEIRLLQRLA